MHQPDVIASKIAAAVGDLPAAPERRLIALAGPPGSGKSTVAAELCAQLGAAGHRTALVAMDGFHLDNPILEARGLFSRKGAPETFDLAGFEATLNRLRTEGEVIIPRFSRTLDAAIGSAVVVEADVTCAIVEGNYLLLDAPGWRRLHSMWAFSAFLDVALPELTRRLEQRWLDNGHTRAGATERVQLNDLPNAQQVLEQSIKADLTL